MSRSSVVTPSKEEQELIYAASKIPQFIEFLELECVQLEEMSIQASLAAQARHNYAQSLIFALKSYKEKEKNISSPIFANKDKRKSAVVRKKDNQSMGTILWNEFRVNLFDVEIDQSLQECHVLEEFAKMAHSLCQDLKKEIVELQESTEKERSAILAEREK